MTTKQITKQLHDELTARMNEIQEQLSNAVVIEDNPEESYGQWVPDIGQDYWDVNVLGSIRKWYWKNDELDLQALALGNIFKTEEEAQSHLEYLKANTKVINRIKELNEGWVPVFEQYASNYCIYYDHLNHKFKCQSSVLTQSCNYQYYLKSEEVAKKLIEELPNELKIVLGIKL